MIGKRLVFQCEVVTFSPDAEVPGSLAQAVTELQLE